MQVEEFKILVEQLTGRMVRSGPSDDAFLTSALKKDEAVIDCSQFNELLLICNKDRVEEPFFRFFFVPNKSKQLRCRVREIRDGVKKFQKSAMLCFGNFIYAFRELSKITDPEGLKGKLGDHCCDSAQFAKHFSDRRNSILNVSVIGYDETYLLGYISSGQIREEHKVAVKLDELLSKRRYGSWKQLTQALAGLKEGVPDTSVIDDSLKLLERFRANAPSKTSLDDFRKRLQQDLPTLKRLHKKLDETEVKGTRNTDVYLTWDHMDVYFATSMRKHWEYKDLFTFVQNVTEKERIQCANNKTLKELNVRYFDPTQSFDKNRINKGLVEALMLKRAACTVYSVQDTDTLGKDSELAATLAQGKPVITYAPVIKLKERVAELIDQHPATLKDRLQFVLYADEQVLAKDLAPMRAFLGRLDNFLDARLWRSLPDSSGVATFKRNDRQELERLCRIIATSEARIYDKRARTLQKTHPLAIQVNLDTGVANGVIVVRDEATCAELIWRILTNALRFDVKYNPKTDCWELIEEITESVFRVVTRNPKLTNSFWNFYPQRNL